MAHEDKDEGGYGPHMKKVAWTILVMGVSLALVIFAWLWIGHIGPNYTAGVMQEQQKTLRDKYGLPSQETSTAELEVPPSLRGIEGASGSATSTAGNVTGSNAAGNATTVANQTAAGNQTTGNATSGNQTAGGNAMGAESGSALKVSIVSGAASKTNDAYNPNPVKAKASDTVTWTAAG